MSESQPLRGSGFHCFFPRAPPSIGLPLEIFKIFSTYSLSVYRLILEGMRVLACTLSFLVFSFVSCSSETVTHVVAPSVETLNADQLREMIENDPDVVFVDVRSAMEIQYDGTIEGFVHIPIEEFEQRYSEIPKDKTIIVACAMGARAGRGAKILREHGYQRVYAVGMREYKDKGYPLIYPKLAD